MDRFLEIDGFNFSIRRDSVMKRLHCYEDNPVYDVMIDEFDELYEDMLAQVEPVGVLGLGTLPKEFETDEYKAGSPIIYAVTSIGGGIKARGTQAFAESDYVKGMLCDAMADDALFSMEERMLEVLKAFCEAHHVGIQRRLEAPHDIPMQAQRAAWEYLELEKRFGITITEGFMFNPVKTSCQVFVLTEDKDLFRASHDCRRCDRLDCKMRNIPPTQITVKSAGGEQVLTLKKGESLMELLLREGYYISAVCGGRGRCGKCKVKVLDGICAVSPEDEMVFTREELKEGWRLSCEAYPEDDLVISFELKGEEEFEVPDCETIQTGVAFGSDKGYDVAVDIGTTTIAMQLISKESGEVCGTVTMINGQRKFGADVITRIQASVDHKGKLLQESIRADLQRGLKQLTLEAGCSLEQIKKIAIAGNTTMGHLLMGYPCDSLGVYPFTPVNIDFIKGNFADMIGSEACGAEIVLLPGISTYVGGDIVSGLYACGLDKENEVSLLIDLGTNGEMAIGNCERILSTSTAAGPAFEGGNITWGTGSIPGAICSVSIEDETATVKTIRDEVPTGICGTGVVETVAEMLKEELVDETGLLDDEYFDDGFCLAETADGEEIMFTQKDVREIQLAKAAIRAGIETLLVRYGVEKEQVAKVYLAGGFGYKLDLEKAFAIGMLPEEFRGKVEAVGNSSLHGAVKYLREAQGDEAVRRIVDVSEEIGLSTDKDFNEFYMDAMMFEE